MADARAFKQWTVALRLLERGARTTLPDAATLGLTDRVEEYFAGPTPPTPDDLSYAFWSACHSGPDQVAEYLLDRSADLNWIPPWGERHTAGRSSARTRRRARTVASPPRCEDRDRANPGEPGRTNGRAQSASMTVQWVGHVVGRGRAVRKPMAPSQRLWIVSPRTVRALVSTSFSVRGGAASPARWSNARARRPTAVSPTSDVT